MGYKKTKSEGKPLYEVVEVIKPIWENVPTGTEFTGTINDRKVIGRIFKRGRNVFLCQNERDGSRCENLLGYKYSWALDNAVTITSLKADPSFTESPKILWCGNPVEFCKVGIIATDGEEEYSFTNETILAIAKEIRRRQRASK